MKKIIWVLLGVSLTVNLWLLFRPDPLGVSTPATALVVTANTTKLAATSAPSSAGFGSASIESDRIAALLKALVEIDEHDLVGARDRLRALGADEATIYAVMDGIIRIQFYRVTRTTETENIRKGWWRGDPANGPNKPAWGRQAEAPMFALMGYDPHEIIDFSSRFDFLPKAKADLLAKIAVDYFSLYLRVAEEPNPSNKAADLTTTERRNDVVKLLTPEELAEYDLRFSEFAAQSVRRFSKMQATEKEFRAISPLLDKAQQEILMAGRDANVSPAQRANTQRILEQRAFDELVVTVGYDRAADYVWSGNNVVVRDPATSEAIPMPAMPNASRVMQLASETGAAAAAIHYDSSLSTDAKRAALLALQQTTQPKLDKILPPSERENLDPRALVWFNGLGKGEYIAFAPRLAANATLVYSPISVSAPTRTEPPVAPQIRPVK